MSVGLLLVRLLYRFYVCVHLSKWFTFFSFKFVAVCSVVVFLRLLVTTVRAKTNIRIRFYLITLHNGLQDENISRVVIRSIARLISENDKKHLSRRVFSPEKPKMPIARTKLYTRNMIPNSPLFFFRPFNRMWSQPHCRLMVPKGCSQSCCRC